MIIHKLIAQYVRRRDDADFYLCQAEDAIKWIQRCGVVLGPGTRALDLGCGHGVFGAQLAKHGCPTTFADTTHYLLPEVADAPFKKFNIGEDDLATLGQFDLVVCSNVYEHLNRPDEFLESVHQILAPNGKLYLSWTNWLSPWGGHEFSPFHYLGAHRGHLLYDRIRKPKQPRNHTPFENLFPTYIGRVLKKIRRSPTLKILRGAPRYYTEFGFVLHIPVVREFATWNCALLIGRKGNQDRL